MYKSDVIAYYGTAVEVTSSLELKSSGTVSQWKVLIPEKQAMRLERLTGGKLVYIEQLNLLSQRRWHDDRKIMQFSDNIC